MSYNFEVKLICNGLKIEKEKVYNILCFHNVYERIIGKVVDISVDNATIVVDYSQQYSAARKTIKLDEINEIYIV